MLPILPFIEPINKYVGEILLDLSLTVTCTCHFGGLKSLHTNGDPDFEIVYPLRWSKIISQSTEKTPLSLIMTC